MRLRFAPAAHVLTFVAVVTICSIARSSNVIYDNGDPDFNAATSDFDKGTEQGDDFSLSSGQTTIRDIHWWGVYEFTNTPPEHDNFTIQIFDFEDDAPAFDPFYSNNVGHVSREVSGSRFKYGVIMPAIDLAPDTPYLLSIVNDTTGHADDWDWSFSDGSAGDSWFRPVGNDWIPADSTGGRELAFYLTVPEPSTITFAVLGLVGIGCHRRKRM